MRRRAITVLALVCALTAGAATAALAASSDTPSAAISDCNTNGQLTAHYSSSTLRAALAQMPADVREYTDCYDVIERQLFKQLGNTSGGNPGTTTSGSGSSFLPTWLIVVIVLLALTAITFGALAIRRRGAGSGEPAAPGGPGPGSGGPDGPGGSGPDPGPGAAGGPGASSPGDQPPPSGPPAT